MSGCHTQTSQDTLPLLLACGGHFFAELQQVKVDLYLVYNSDAIAI